MNLQVNGSNHFLRSAQGLVESSLADIKTGHYLDSWLKMVPARTLYLLDAIQCAILTPFALLETAFAFVEAFITWGHQAAHLKESALQLLDLVNRVLIGVFGATISPTIAYVSRDSNVLLGMCQVLAAFSPNSVYYVPGHGAAFGWHL